MKLPDVTPENLRIVLEWCEIHINTPMIPLQLPIRKGEWKEMMVTKQGLHKADRTQDMDYIDKYFVEVNGDKYRKYFSLINTAHALMMINDLLRLYCYRFAHEAKFMSPKEVEEKFDMKMPTDPEKVARAEKVLEEIVAEHQKKQAQKAAAAVAA